LQQESFIREVEEHVGKKGRPEGHGCPINSEGLIREEICEDRSQVKEYASLHPSISKDSQTPSKRHPNQSDEESTILEAVRREI
jgi:hypothetical protein